MTESRSNSPEIEVKRFEWASWHPVLSALAKPSLENLFAGSTRTLSGFAAIDEALEVVNSALRRDRLSALAAEELHLLKKAIAWRGYLLAEEEKRILRFEVITGRADGDSLTHGPAAEASKHYREILAVSAENKAD